MNEIIIPDGGMPVTRQDLQWMQDAYRDAFEGVLSFAKTQDIKNFIISGCEVATEEEGGVTTYTVSPGYIYLMGEVLKVDGHTVEGASSLTPYFFYQQTLSGQKTFFNKKLYSVRSARRGRLFVGEGTPGNYVKPGDTLVKCLGDNLGDTWHKVGDPVTGLGTTYNEGYSGTLCFKKLDRNTACISGLVYLDGITNLVVFENLPDDYRPITSLYGVYSLSGSAQYYHLYEFENNLRLTQADSYPSIVPINLTYPLSIQ